MTLRRIAQHPLPYVFSLRVFEDVFAGHRATGEYDPTLWYVAKSDGEAVGVLLLSPVAGRSCFEVVYMGVDPKHRGSGLGSALLAHACRVCGDRGIDELILAVDRENTPARVVYDRWAFATIAQRNAWILPLVDGGID